MILLDTHAWLWWCADPARLSRRARALIEEAPVRAVSPLSCFEVVRLAVRGRIALDRPAEVWVRQALGQPGVEELPPSAAVAARAAALPDAFPGDPVDRLLYATALAARVALLTKDRRLRDFDGSTCIW